jgi:hypothetical protein
MPHTWIRLTVQIGPLVGPPNPHGRRCNRLYRNRHLVTVRAFPGGDYNDSKLHKMKRRLEQRNPHLRFRLVMESSGHRGDSEKVILDEIDLRELSGKTDIDTLIKFKKQDLRGLGPSEPEIIGSLSKLAMDTEDTSTMDKVLINLKHSSIPDDQYFRMLRRGVRTALSTSDPSLMETIIYCLGSACGLYPKLLSTAETIEDNRVKKALSWLNLNR